MASGLWSSVRTQATKLDYKLFFHCLYTTTLLIIGEGERADTSLIIGGGEGADT